MSHSPAVRLPTTADQVPRSRVIFASLIGTAFVARPMGAVIFGHLSDRVGRKATLIGALLTMGIATFLIGLLPTYFHIGLWASATTPHPRTSAATS